MSSLAALPVPTNEAVIVELLKFVVDLSICPELVAESLATAQQGKHKQAVAECLASVWTSCVPPESNVLLYGVGKSVAMELRKSVNNTGETLRGNDLGSKVYTQFLQHDADCQSYLKQLLGAWLVELLAVGDAAATDAGESPVEKLVEQLLARLLVVPLPRRLRFVSHLVKEEADALQMEWQQSVGALLVLRFINPAVALPQQHGVLPNATPLPATAQQGLMRAAKSLQLVANGKVEGSRQQLLQKFLDLAVVDDVSDRKFSDVKLNRRCPVSVVSGLDVATLTLIVSVVASQQREDYRALIERAQRLVQLVATAGNAPSSEGSSSNPQSSAGVPSVTINAASSTTMPVTSSSSAPSKMANQQKLPGKPVASGDLEDLELDFNGKYVGVDTQVYNDSDSASDEQWDDSSRFISFVKSFLFIGKSKKYGEREETEDENDDIFDKI